MPKLFPYQLEGAKWLATKRFALLADEQGVGKSAQAIAAAGFVQASSILVVCRAVAVSNWHREFGIWWSGPKPSLIVTSYESLRKVDLSLKFDVLIVDESHYVKEPNARRTKDILGKSGAVHRSKRTWLLTGTPTPNHAAELWTTLYTAGRTLYSYGEFSERYCHTRETGFGRQITGTNVARVSELRENLRPMCLRRTKEQVLKDLPPILFQDVIVKPGLVKISMAKSFDKYSMFGQQGIEELKQDLLEQIGIVNGIVGDSFTFETVKALEARSKSIMTLRRYTGLQKIQPVVDLISDELDNNAYKKIVLFAVHRDTCEGLRDALADKYGAVLIYGGTKPHKIIDRVNRFQVDEKCRVFIGNIQSAGTSITLTASDQVMFVEQGFVPGDMDQAAMRCHRIGQTKPVTVRFIGLENSIDEHISTTLRRKTAEISQLMNGLGAPEIKNELTKEKAKPKLEDLL